MTTLNLKKFNLDKLNNNLIILIQGTRRSGKTTLIKNILNNNKNSLIFTPNEPLSKEYLDFNCESFYKNKVLYNTIKEQYKSKEKFNIVFDDMEHYKIFQESGVKDIFLNKGLLNIFTIFTSQSSIIDSKLLSKIDYIFIFKNTGNIQNLYKKYINTKLSLSYNIFLDIFNTLSDNECLVIKNTKTQCSNYLENLFWYKVDNFETKKICTQEFPTITIDPVVENKSIFSVVIFKFNYLITYLQDFINPNPTQQKLLEQ